MSLILAEAKIALLNCIHRQFGPARQRVAHISGYKSGDSPGTDLLSMVDGKGTVIGEVSRPEAHRNGVLHASVHLMLFDLQQRVLIQQRGDRKESSPGKLAQSVGGHVAAGEKTGETIVRECREELGIWLEHFGRVATYLYVSNSGKNQEFVHLFRGICAGPITPNFSELNWAAFFKLNDLKALAQAKPGLFSPSLLRDLSYF